MALVVALLMLLILTIIGINAITTTTFETSISGNERISTDAFYVAEAGIQVALARIQKDLDEGWPINTNPIPRTKLGEDSYFWSGSPKDKENPKPIQYVGRWWKGGFEASGSGTEHNTETPSIYYRYQLNSTGESFGAMKEIEVQMCYGPF